MFCSGCGTRTAAGAAYCTGCGRSLGTVGPNATPLDRGALGLPKENLVSVFRSPVSEDDAARKRTWAFSTGVVAIGVGVVNLFLGAAERGPNWAIGIVGLIAGIALIGQGILLSGFRQR